MAVLQQVSVDLPLLSDGFIPDLPTSRNRALLQHADRGGRIHANSGPADIYDADQGCALPQLCLHPIWLDFFHHVFKRMGVYRDAEYFLCSWHMHIPTLITTAGVGVVSTS